MALPLNTMKDVDLSRAILRYTEFRNLDLRFAVLPTDPEHIIIRDYERTLACVISRLATDSSREARGLRAALQVMMKWCLPGTTLGILNRHDLRAWRAEKLAEQALAACTSVLAESN